jgi:hypothetical protein
MEPPARAPSRRRRAVSTVDDHLAEGLETMTTDHLTQEQKTGTECLLGDNRG